MTDEEVDKAVIEEIGSEIISKAITAEVVSPEVPRIQIDEVKVEPVVEEAGGSGCGEEDEKRPPDRPTTRSDVNKLQSSMCCMKCNSEDSDAWHKNNQGTLVLSCLVSTGVKTFLKYVRVTYSSIL